MSSLKRLESPEARALGSLAVGVAAGLVVADRLGRPARETVSITLLGLGLVVTVPFLTKYVTRQINAYRFRSRKTLQGIRQSGVSEFSLDPSGESSRELVSA